MAHTTGRGSFGVIHRRVQTLTPPPPCSVLVRVLSWLHMPVQLTPRLSSRRPRFPNRIREYRLKAGLTQKALGTLIGKGRTVISCWERGLYLPRVPYLFRLAKALDTLAEHLYEGLYHAFAGRAEKETSA